MKLLLDSGANANGTNATGATALMWAATDIEKVRLLLSRGADVNVASQRGRTALQSAARSDGSAAIVRLLLDAGADAKAVDAVEDQYPARGDAGQRHRDDPADRRRRSRRECRRLRGIHAADSRGLQQKSRRHPHAARKGRRPEGAVWRRVVSKSEGGLDCARQLDGADGVGLDGDT